MEKMTYQEVRNKVTQFMYTPVKREGGYIHPDDPVMGVDRSSPYYEEHLNNYIKDIYGVEPNG